MLRCIAGQKHEGWELLPDRYDDGGISGGHLDRAALQKLMRAVDDKRVDQIVVYKIDRLTRSLVTSPSWWTGWTRQQPPSPQ